MLFLSNIHGTLTQLTYEPVYRGSSGVNDIVLLAPFASTSVVALYITLPDGVELEPQFATLVNNTADLGVLNTAGKPLNAWKYSLPFVLTEKSGDLMLTFSVTHESGTATVSEIVIPILPGSGFSNPEEDADSFSTIQEAVLLAQTAAASAEDWAANAKQQKIDAQNSADSAEQAAEAAEDAKQEAVTASGAASDAKIQAQQYAADAEDAVTRAAEAADQAAREVQNAQAKVEEARSAADEAYTNYIDASREFDKAVEEANKAKEQADRAEELAESLNVDNLLPKSALEFDNIYVFEFTYPYTGMKYCENLYNPFPISFAELFNVSYSFTAVNNAGDSAVSVVNISTNYSGGIDVISKYGVALTTGGQNYLEKYQDDKITVTVTVNIAIKTL